MKPLTIAQQNALIDLYNTNEPPPLGYNDVKYSHMLRRTHIGLSKLKSHPVEIEVINEIKRVVLTREGQYIARTLIAANEDVSGDDEIVAREDRVNFHLQVAEALKRQRKGY